MSTADREAFDAYRQAALAAYADHLNRHSTDALAFTGADRWSTVPLFNERGTMRGLTDVFRGPWRAIRPYVTTEFRQWVEEHGGERLTYSEWSAARRAERQAERDRERSWLDSPAYCLDRLDQWATLNRERDELIVEARERGASFADLMSALGMSRMAIHNVIVRAAQAIQPASDSEFRMIGGELVEVF